MAGYVPLSTAVTAANNGGGLSFTSFSYGSQDDIYPITYLNQPGLLYNSGPYREFEYLWLTGFPVYDQQTSPNIQNFALLDAGGAYEALFSTPIHESYYSATPNTATFTLLGQNWTIVGYVLPSGTPSSPTVTTHGGKITLASQFIPLTTVYVGKNVTSGPFSVQLVSLGTASTAGVSPAAINIYYAGVLTNSTSIWPANTVRFNSGGHVLYVKVNQTFAGLYAYQQYAKIQLYSSVMNLTDGSVYNQTMNPGWNVNLLWANASGTGHYTDLQSIVIYNTTPTMLTPGQSFNFIQNPQAWRVTFTGDTLGNNWDQMTFTTSYASSVTYQNLGTPSNGVGTGYISNLTEPAQEFIVTSQIPNAFGYLGQSSSTVTYLLTPYRFYEFNHAAASGNSITVTLVTNYPAANFISASNPLLVTVSGYATNTATSPVSTTLTFSSATSGNILSAMSFYNITSIRLNRALPQVGIIVRDSTDAWMAVLGSYASPFTLYGPYGGVVSTTTAVTYNQQNGQPTTTFDFVQYSMSQSAPYNFYAYQVPEINTPANTASQDSFIVNIVNSTAGAAASPLFQLGYSAYPSMTPNNLTYISSAGSSINAKVGFRSERGSLLSTISGTQVWINMAKQNDTLQFVVNPQVVTVTTSTTTSTVSTTTSIYGGFTLTPNPPSVTNPMISIGQSAVLNATLSGGVAPYAGMYDYLILYSHTFCNSGYCQAPYSGGPYLLKNGGLNLIVKALSPYKLALITTDPYVSPNTLIIGNLTFTNAQYYNTSIYIFDGLSNGQTIFGTWYFKAEGYDNGNAGYGPTITHNSIVSNPASVTIVSPGITTTTTTVTPTCGGCTYGTCSTGVCVGYTNSACSSGTAYYCEGTTTTTIVSQAVPTITIYSGNPLNLNAGGWGVVYFGTMPAGSSVSTNTSTGVGAGFSENLTYDASNNGVSYWSLIVHTTTSTLPGTYHQVITAVNPSGGLSTNANITIVISPPTSVKPIIFLTPNSINIYPGQNVTVNITAANASGGVGFNTRVLQSFGLNFGFTFAPGTQPKPPYYGYAFFVNASKNAVPGNYTFAVDAANITTGQFAYAYLAIHVLSSPTPPKQVSVYASDSSDPYLRYWELFNVFPGGYYSFGNYANQSSWRQTFWSGSTMQIPSSYYNSTFYLAITQSGGPFYGTYSGVVLTNNGPNWTFSGLDACHVLKLTLSNGAIVAASVVALPCGQPTTSTTVSTTLLTTLPINGTNTTSVSTLPTTSTSTIETTTTLPVFNYTNFTINFQPGWNLFSIPLTYVASASGNCTHESFSSPIWQLDGNHYRPAKYLVGGVGYWVKVKEACTETFYGPELQGSPLTSLSGGWNLVGGPAQGASLQQLLPPNCELKKVPRGFDSGSNAYYNASTLTPGKGYFVDVAADCYSSGSAPPPVPR